MTAGGKSSKGPLKVKVVRGAGGAGGGSAGGGAGASPVGGGGGSGVGEGGEGNTFGKESVSAGPMMKTAKKASQIDNVVVCVLGFEFGL